MNAISSPSAMTAQPQGTHPRLPRGIWFKRGLVGVLAMLAAGAIYQAVATARDRRNFPPPGQLVDVGGYRLHLHPAGLVNHSPTVILDPGLGLPTSHLALLQDEIALLTRVVAYDRAGIGWSDTPPPDVTRDALTNAQTLHFALQAAHFAPPYVLVGHSMGGMNMLVFAHEYPAEVAGLVLVDSEHPDQFKRYDPEHANDQQLTARMARMWQWAAYFGLLRLLDSAQVLEANDLPARARAELQAYFVSPRMGQAILAEMAAWEELTFPQVRGIKTLGNKPLVVLTAEVTGQTVPVQVEMHREYAALSTNSLHRIVAGASHGGIVSRPDYARAVVEAVQQVMESARTGQPLASVEK